MWCDNKSIQDSISEYNSDLIREIGCRIENSVSRQILVLERWKRSKSAGNRSYMPKTGLRSQITPRFYGPRRVRQASRNLSISGPRGDMSHSFFPLGETFSSFSELPYIYSLIMVRSLNPNNRDLDFFSHTIYSRKNFHSQIFSILPHIHSPSSTYTSYHTSIPLPLKKTFIPTLKNSSRVISLLLRVMYISTIDTYLGLLEGIEKLKKFVNLHYTYTNHLHRFISFCTWLYLKT